MNIGERIHNIIDDREIKQKALANRLDIPVTTFNGYMKGRTQFPCEVVVQVANELNVTTDYLLGTAKYPDKPFPLSASEQKIVQSLRSLTPQQKELIMQTLRLMLEQNQK